MLLFKSLLFTVGACLSLSDICGANQLEKDATLNPSQESNRSEMCTVARGSSEKKRRRLSMA